MFHALSSGTVSCGLINMPECQKIMSRINKYNLARFYSPRWATESSFLGCCITLECSRGLKDGLRVSFVGMATDAKRLRISEGIAAHL